MVLSKQTGQDTVRSGENGVGGSAAAGARLGTVGAGFLVNGKYKVNVIHMDQRSWPTHFCYFNPIYK